MTEGWLCCRCSGSLRGGLRLEPKASESEHYTLTLNHRTPILPNPKSECLNVYPIGGKKYTSKQNMYV